jgi:4'-phosphopantetheinyl transferase
MKCVHLLNYFSQYCRLDLDHIVSTKSVVLGESNLVWVNPSEILSMDPGGLHVWRARLDEPVYFLDHFSSVLSHDELVRAGRFHFEKDRGQFVARRGLLRMILGQYLQVEPARIRFTYGAFGKPELFLPYNADLHFSLSISDDWAIFIVTAEAPVGVDVERVRMIAEADEIVARYFSQQEVADWRSRPSKARPQVFLQYWTRKESYLKASGGGIGEAVAPTQPTSSIATLDGNPLNPNIYETNDDCIAWSLIPAPGYIASIALRHKLSSCECVVPDWFMAKCSD